MNREVLLNSAKTLNNISIEAAHEYAAKAELLAIRVSEIIANREDVTKLIGEGNYDMMKDNHLNHARFMSSILKHYQPEVFIETILWVFRAYRSRGFSTTYWAAQINAWICVIKEEINSEYSAEILPYYEWIQINIPLFASITD